MNIVRYQRYPQRDLSIAFSRFNNIQAELDRVFGTSFGSLVRPGVSPNRWNPPVDVYQDKDQFTVYAELPGFKKEEIEIALNGDTLTIGGERKQEANSLWTCMHESGKQLLAHIEAEFGQVDITEGTCAKRSIAGTTALIARQTSR